MNDFIYVIENSIPSDLCKDIINKFNIDPEKSPGKLFPGRVDISEKNSMDLLIMERYDWQNITRLLVQYLFKSLETYASYIEKDLRDTGISKHIKNILLGDAVKITDFQIQHYKSGGLFKWHSDNEENINRFLSFIWYLNTVDIENGGSTDFLNGKSIQPKEGSILFFPATWNCIHRGNILKSGDKYIITGFICK